MTLPRNGQGSIVQLLALPGFLAFFFVSLWVGVRLLAQWVPRAIYFAVLIAIGIQIINFWSGYYSGIFNQLGE